MKNKEKKFKVPEELNDAVDFAFENRNPKNYSKKRIKDSYQKHIKDRADWGMNTKYIVNKEVGYCLE